MLMLATQVVEVVDEHDVVCVAKNEALLDGLLTVFHVERSSDELLNLQNDLPLLSEYDKECIISLAQVRHNSVICDCCEAEGRQSRTRSASSAWHKCDEKEYLHNNNQSL
jgi:2-phospho-L-lactate guanylyltransferase (CobY/MobA/RfbA family)